MKLIHTATGEEVKAGDKVTSFRGEVAYVSEWDKPHNAASTGRIYVKRHPNAKQSQGYYPSVYGMEWIEREDQGWKPEPTTAPPPAVTTKGEVLSFDRFMLEALKKARQDCLDRQELIFTFEGAPLRVDYAKYLIQYLESRLA